MNASSDRGPMRDAHPLRGLGRHGVLNASAIIIPGVYSVLAIGAILHALGPTSYAPWATAVVLLGWVNLLDLGLAQTVIRASARAMLGDEGGRADVRQATSVYAVLGLAAGAAGLVVATQIPVILSLQPDEAGVAIQAGGILALDAAIVLGTAAWTGVLRGTGRFGHLVAVSATQVAVSVPILVMLLPTIGLLGAATAQLAGRLVSRALAAWLLHNAVPWFRLRPRRPSRSGILVVGRFSAPIFLIQLASQIGTGTDILIVGVTAGAGAAGLFATGAQLVRYLAYFLFPIIDVVYPRLASLEYARPDLAGPILIRTLFLAATIGTVAFAGLAMEGSGALLLWSGQSPTLSVTILMLYAVTYSIITPAHLMVLALIARGSHRGVALVILTEAIVNLGLSVALTIALGPIGPAVSTLIVVSVDDLLVIPWLTSRRLGVQLYRLALAGFGGAAIGLAILATTTLIPGDGPIPIVARGSLGAVLLAMFMIIGLRRDIAPTSPITSELGDEGKGA